MNSHAQQLVTRWSLPAAVAVLVIVIAAGLYTSGFFAPPKGNSCMSDSLSHVYNPNRLRLINACQTVSGTVEKVIQEGDGDAHIRLQVDHGYESLLNQANFDYQYGTLVLEIVCVYPTTLADAVSACSGYTNPISIPSVGEHTSVVGQHVTDLTHEWNEIHPVYSIQVSP